MSKIKAIVFNSEDTLLDLTGIGKGGNCKSYPATRVTIGKLKRRGLQLAIVSDTNEQELYHRLHVTKLIYDDRYIRHNFMQIGTGSICKNESSFLRLKTAIAFLNDINVLPENYKKLKKYELFPNIKPDEILLVSSTRKQIKLAERLGLKTVLAKYIAVKKDMCKTDFTINDISGILKIV